MTENRGGEGGRRSAPFADGFAPAGRIEPYRTSYAFAETDAASTYTVVSTKALSALSRYRLSGLAHVVFAAALAEPSASGPEGGSLPGQGLVRLDPEKLADHLGVEADEIAAAVQELADRSLLLEPGDRVDDVWQINPVVAFRGSAAAQHEALDRVVQQRGGSVPVLPEPGTTLVGAATGKLITA
ncbi:hypothetical protein ACFVT9_29190 [Kitasatospora cineracea]|uniref:hypothetical protein n=1 Tax=Kitasatospora cineracea TaxID=88074 RepID=UPI0036D8B13A